MLRMGVALSAEEHMLAGCCRACANGRGCCAGGSAEALDAPKVRLRAMLLRLLVRWLHLCVQ